MLHRAIAVVALCIAASAWTTGSETFVTVRQADSSRSSIDRPGMAVSRDGRYVAFESYAQLSPADTNRQSDIYVLDRSTGSIELESGELPEASVDALHPSISGDGSVVVFEAGGALILRDRRRHDSHIVGPGRDPAVSSDGRFLAFTKGATIELVDIADGTHRPIASPADSSVERRSAVSPSVTADAAIIAFSSRMTLLRSPAKAQRTSEIYLGEMKSTEATSINRIRRLVGPSSWSPSISADGSLVAFVSTASDLVAGDGNQSPDIFVAHVATGAIELVSRTPRGTSGNGSSNHPAISADGRFVVFQSTASNLICQTRCTGDAEDINLLPDIFLFDRSTRVTTCISADGSRSWMEESAGPAIDGTGNTVVFSSRHPIDSADIANDFDLFVWHR